MNEFMKDYLTACIENAHDVRMAVTTNAHLAVEENMLTSKLHEALTSIGQASLVKVCLQYSEESFLNVNGTAPIQRCKAFNKLVDVCLTQLKVRKSAYTETLIAMRLAHLMYMLKCSMSGQIIAVDLLDINQIGYSTILAAVSSEAFDKVKNKVVCIPLLQNNMYTGTKCIVKYIADCKAFMISVEHDDYMYAAATLYVYEDKPKQFILSYCNALKADGSTLQNITVDCNTDLRKNLVSYATIYAAVCTALIQLDTVKVVYSETARTKKQSTSGDSTDKLVPVAKTKYIYTHPSTAKHGTHCSPREHIRKGHYRHYKSGKVVFIAESIINKGHDKTLYKTTKI